MKENQIKAEKQLTDLTERFSFLSETFHEFAADRKLKEEITKTLRGQVLVLHDDFKKMEAQVDEQVQHSHRNCFLFHEIKEQKGEDTGSIIIKTVKEEMDTEILPNDLDRSHRIGIPKTKKKDRPIIVKFVRLSYKVRIVKFLTLFRMGISGAAHR